MTRVLAVERGVKPVAVDLHRVEAVPGARVPRAQVTSRVAWLLFVFELDRLFDEHDATHGELGARLGVSRASVSQMIVGKNLFSRAAVEVLAGFFGVEAYLSYLLGLNAAARAGGRAARPSNGVGDPGLGMALESIAKSVVVVDFGVVPPLLQVLPYARRVRCAELLRHVTQDYVDDLPRRQQVLVADPPTRVTWFTDEAALRRLLVAVPESVAREQVVRLAGMGAVDLRVVPGARAAVCPPLPFTVVELDDGHRSVHERTVSAVRNLRVEGIHAAVVDELDGRALNREESVALLADLARAVVGTSPIRG